MELGILGPWLAGQEPHKIFTATSLAVLITLWHAVLDCSNQHGFNSHLRAQVRRIIFDAAKLQLRKPVQAYIIRLNQCFIQLLRGTIMVFLTNIFYYHRVKNAQQSNLVQPNGPRRTLPGKINS